MAGKYVDGFIIPIPKKNLRAYRKMAQMGCKAWMKHGALEYYETTGDDLKSPWGIPFPKLCKLKPGETVIFAFIVFKSKAHRNQVNKKVMADEQINSSKEMPFDMKRFSYGGFKVLIAKNR